MDVFRGYDGTRGCAAALTCFQPETAMPADRLQDRAAGALLGAFIGDALALGPHWYYNLDELRADFGEWITGYTDPGAMAQAINAAGMLSVGIGSGLAHAGLQLHSTQELTWKCLTDFWASRAY